MAMDKALIQIHALTKKFRHGQAEIVALDDVNLEIGSGEFVALMGPSGSGKSTLLYIIAGLDVPTSGNCIVGGMQLFQLPDRELTCWRQQNVGFIFQTFNLIPVLTAFENVELPLLVTRLNRKERRTHVEAALELVGLADRRHHLPSQLSGGQEQRVAIARALVVDPLLIVADEPTGNLDARSAEEILNLMHELNQKGQKTVVLVTHDPKAARRAGRTLLLEKGQLRPQTSGPNPFPGFATP